MLRSDESGHAGARTASSTDILKSIKFTSTCWIADGIRFEPPLPIAIKPLSGARATEGDIIELSRDFDGQPVNPPGLTSCSPSILFSIIEVPGIIVPHPSPLLTETDAAFRCRSIMEI